MNDAFLDYLEDILEAMSKAEYLLEDVTFEEFESDYRINFAVVRALEIIGEATKRLPHDLRQRYTDIPWREMAGMRDRIIHEYDNVNLHIVWETVKRRIPEVKPQLEQILAEFDGR